jgi:eukaryotic-like serine/threonine-protein kinase
VGAAVFATGVIRSLQELGCYHLEEKLDHGGMGEIWRARHRMLARPVAVKLIRPELLGVKTPVEAASLVARFQREAEATSALHSSHTISLHDFGVTPEGAFYYVMELLDGLDLETLVRRYGPVPPERAIHILIQACDSLAEAHATGLIHRDVKPSNILTCHWGLKWDFVKVLDFGLVKTAWAMGNDDHLTSEGTITGTPAYMAPEAALGGVPIDARVDLYGLGCVAYWLLTGERVFVGRTPVEVLLHHVKTPPLPPSERSGREIPDALEQVVLSCLAKDPDDRPQSAEWLASLLAACVTAEAWTPDRARAWWEDNRPASEARTPAAAGTTVTPASPPAPQAR